MLLEHDTILDRVSGNLFALMPYLSDEQRRTIRGSGMLDHFYTTFATFETEVMTEGKNLAALTDLSGQLIDHVHARRPVTIWSGRSWREERPPCSDNNQSRTVGVKARLYDKIAGKFITAASIHWAPK
jgi:hypothetical protein